MSKKNQKKQKIKVLTNPYIIRPGQSIGFLDAESDRTLLDQAYYDKEDLQIIKDVTNPRCILVGRTGSGKTAFLSTVENSPNFKVFRIEPEHMSLRYLSNSDIIQYFEKLNIKLDLIYKTLWKHVFVVEFLRMYCGTDTSKRDNIIDRIFNSDRIKAKKIAQEYLEKWKNSFWENSETKIKEIESNLRTSLGKKFNFNPEFSSMKLGELANEHEKETSETIRREIYNKSQSIVNETQISDLSSVIDTIKTEIFDSRQAKYFIIIDDLDKEWVDKRLVYDLIRTMIEAINDLNRIDGIKIVVALRENLLNLVINSSNRGHQREKFDSQIQKIVWSRQELYQIVNKRISIVFKEKHTNQTPIFEEIFKYQINGSNGAFDYILDRTLMRPRDLMDYVNICIKNASGKSEVNGEIIRNSEREYSLSRIRAIQDEWVENYPFIRKIVLLLQTMPENFSFSLFEQKFTTFLADHFPNEASISEIKDSRIESLIREYHSTMEVDPSLTKAIIMILFNVGLIGIKPSTADKTEYSHLVSYWGWEESQIKEDTRIYIHKMFSRALNCTTKQ